MKKTTMIYALTGVLALACDSVRQIDASVGGNMDATVNAMDATPGADAMAMEDAGAADTGMMMGRIPDPGNAIGFDWTDPEPNDTPDHAVPSGIFTGALWMGGGSPQTTIASNTDVDYYVFKTGDQMSLMGGSMQICWSFMGHLLDMALYLVTADGQKGSLVAMANATTGGCQTLIPSGMTATVLMPMTTYLLEVSAAPGLNLNGMSGLYSA